MGNWRPINDPDLWLNSLSVAVEYLEARRPNILPDFSHSQRLWITSDYGGDHENSKYDVYSFCVATSRSIPIYNELRLKMRAATKMGLGTSGRRMRYSRIPGDRLIRERALEAYLRVAGQLTGVTLTLAVDKRVPRFNVPDFSDSRLAIYKTWNPYVLNRFFVITHAVSLLIGCLVSEGQHVFWVSDNDPIWQHPTSEIATLGAFVMRPYVRHAPRFDFSYDTTDADDGSLLIEDLASIPDLIAGAFAEMSTASISTLSDDNRLVMVSPSSARLRSVWDWLHLWQPLKHIFVRYDVTGERSARNIPLVKVETLALSQSVRESPNH